MELAYDAMDAASLHAHAGANRVDALVVALHSDFSALSRDACDLVDGDESVVDLWYLQFEEALQEHRTGAAEDNLRVIVLIIHTRYHCTYSLTLAIEVGRNLVLLGQI